MPTPVGNLEDITLRALRILKEADLVLAEDTRTSGILLKHYEIKNQLVAHHKFNEHQTAEAFAARMAGGEIMALVSDAGTPGISDPGFMLVRACVARSVCPVPRLSFRHWWLRACLANAFASRASCRRKKDATRACNRSFRRNAP